MLLPSHPFLFFIMGLPDMLSCCLSGVNSNCRGTQVCTSLYNTERAQQFCSFLFRRGWISGYRVVNRFVIELDYKYHNNRNTFSKIQLLSTPGNRLFYSHNKLSRFCSYPRMESVLVLSTNKGFLSSSEALHRQLGGELVARIIE